MFWSSTRTTIQNKHQNKHKNGSLSTKMNLLPLLSLSSDLNPVENEWGELKRRSTVMELWIWRIWSDSGWRKWSLISYQVFSKLFRHYRRKLRAVTLGISLFQHEIVKAFISQWDFPPTFNCFTSMIGWNFVNFWMKDKKDKTMQIYFHSRPLVIFTKGANISGGHCTLNNKLKFIFCLLLLLLLNTHFLFYSTVGLLQ